jgi:hypothetical protein
MNNGDTANAIPFIAATATKQMESVTPFTFGPVTVGAPYKIQVKDQPYGKNCVVSGSSEGTITTQAALNIRVDCTSITTATDPRYVPRYSVRVQVPDAFIGTKDAKVTLSTEDGLFEKLVPSAAATVACGANKCVEFADAVVSVPTVCTPATPTGVACAANTPVQATPIAFRYAQTVFPYAVTASNTVGDVLNKCRVDNATNATAGVSTLARPTTSTAQPEVIVVPTANVTNVVVGSCNFTISGTVSYNLLSGGTAPAMGAGGLTMELRNAAGKLLEGTTPVNVTAFGPVTLTTIAKSNQLNGLLDVVITRHPDGQFCIFDTSINLNLFVPGTTTNPTDKTISIQCRDKPTDTAKQLRGIYRLTSSTYQATSSAAAIGPVVWQPFSATAQNIASSNHIAFFDDGTFLYGTHGVTAALILVQIEHGFYDFDPVTRVLRFGLVTDTNPRTFFGQTTVTVSAAGVVTTNNAAFANLVSRTATPGLSATPGFSTTTRTTTLSNVQFGSAPAAPPGTTDPAVRTMSGSFGTLTATTPKLDWVLSEPISRANEWSGAWITQDHRRFVVWDFNTLYVMHVGVSGGSANMQDVCLSTDDLHAPFGLYVRRAAGTGCYPVNRQYPGQTPAYVISSFEAPDAPVSAANQNPLRNPEVATTPLTEIPGFVGRIPGGAPQFDLRSPSPMYYRVQPATAMASNDRQDLFPSPITNPVPYTTNATFESWCPVETGKTGTGEILGLRATLNDIPVEYPVYLCRYRANQ